MTTPGRWLILGFDARHEPVLAHEVVALLQPRPDGIYVDCTVGLGGHTAALFAAGAGRVIGLDRDAGALAHAGDRLSAAGARLELVHADYRDLPRVLGDRGVGAVDGVLADLGVSSWQLDDPARGFSFRASGPLDMRMDASTGPTAADLVATADEVTLADAIYRFGEERHSRRIARAIVRARDRGPILDTGALAAVVRAAAGGRGWQRIDPATRTFQALRIWVNRELDGLDVFLESAVAALSVGGRLAVIAFHSLEDRIVKHTFRRLTADETYARALTRKPIRPGEAEVEHNPRARSARLRAVELVRVNVHEVTA
jgi:16S rRNA (cytosine1402-N4)-methyltransferase